MRLLLENKWLREVGILNKKDFINNNHVIRNLKEIALQDLLFKLTNKILVTKSFLHRTGKINDNQCSYYYQNIETIHHLFIECDEVKQFWQELRECLFFSFQLNISFGRFF